MNQSKNLVDLFDHLNDPKVLEAVNKRFQELSVKYPTTEIDRVIERSKRAQWWHATKDLRITI